MNEEAKNKLPDDLKAAVEYGLVRSMDVVAELRSVKAEFDKAKADHQAEVADLKTTIAGLKVTADVLQTTLNNVESQIQTAHLVRDQSVADRIKYEALFISIQAQLRAFAVPAAPLIRAAEDNDAGEPDKAHSGVMSAARDPHYTGIR